MAFSDRFTGEGLVVEAVPTGGSILTLSTDYTTFAFNRQWDNVDVTAGNEIARAKLPTKEDATWSLEVFGGDDVTWSAFIGTRTGVMTVYRHGKGAGKEYFSFNYLLEGADLSTGTDAAETLSMSGSRHGEMLVPYGSLQSVTPTLMFDSHTSAADEDEVFVLVVLLEDGASNPVLYSGTPLITLSFLTGTGALEGVLQAYPIEGEAIFHVSADTDGAKVIKAEATGWVTATTGVITISDPS